MEGTRYPQNVSFPQTVTTQNNNHEDWTGQIYERERKKESNR